MTDLRERLRAGDPALAARPLDADETAAMRRAMASARPQPRRGTLAAGLALAATGLAAAALLLLWPEAPPAPAPVSAPVVVASVPPHPVVQAPPVSPPVVAEVRVPRRRKTVPAPAPPAERMQVREVRFVTAKGTQILWTFRSSEEGA